jgi:hypothetical protein
MINREIGSILVYIEIYEEIYGDSRICGNELFTEETENIGAKEGIGVR